MVDTGAGSNNIFWKIEHIQIEGMHHQAHVYFVLLGIRKVGNQILSNPLLVSALKKCQKKNFRTKYDRVRSNMIDKAIYGSITNSSLKKLTLR